MPGQSAAATPALMQLRKKSPFRDSASTARMPRSAMSDGAGRLDPVPKLRPATMTSPALTDVAHPGRYVANSCGGLLGTRHAEQGGRHHEVGVHVRLGEHPRPAGHDLRHRRPTRNGRGSVMTPVTADAATVAESAR